MDTDNISTDTTNQTPTTQTTPPPTHIHYHLNDNTFTIVNKKGKPITKSNTSETSFPNTNHNSSSNKHKPRKNPTTFTKHNTHYTNIPSTINLHLTNAKTQSVPHPKRTKDELELQTIINNDPNSLHITNIPQLSDADIKICTLNINSLNTHKLQCVLTYIQHLTIDIMILVDTRHRDTTTRHYTNILKSSSLVNGPTPFTHQLPLTQQNSTKTKAA
jgi:hypothetical protein